MIAEKKARQSFESMLLARYIINGEYMTDRPEALHYAYHPVHGTLCVHTTEYSKLLLNGWYDNPGKFPAPKSAPLKIQDLYIPTAECHEAPIVLSDSAPVGKPIQYKRGRPKKEVPVIVEEPVIAEPTDDEKAALFITGTMDDES